jgi:diamine N-acetyltransferase
MNLRLVDVTEENFWDVINLKSDENQQRDIQIFERWVGSNTFFLAAAQVYGFIPKAIYDGEVLIGFASHGFRKEHNRYELISIMVGHQFQGKGYGLPVLKAVVEDMVQTHNCNEIYLSVIHDNERAIRIYEKVGFEPTGEIEQGHHPEPVYRLKVQGVMD